MASTRATRPGWSQIECERRVLDPATADEARLHSGHFFHSVREGRLVASTVFGPCDAALGDLLLFPAGMVYRLRPAGRLPCEIITLRVRSRAFVPAQAPDRQAWETLQRLIARSHTDGPSLPLGPRTTRRTAELLDELAREAATPGPAHEAAMKASCLAWLVALARDEVLSAEGPPATAAAQIDRLREVLWHLESHFAEDVRVADLAAMAGLGRSQFHALFRRALGQSVMEYVTRLRMALACQLLGDTATPIADIADRCGYASLSRFYEAFGRVVGTSPARYRRRR